MSVNMKVKAEPLTAEAFAPFGKVVDVSRHTLHCQPGEYTARLHALERAQSLVRRVNRHSDHEQLFVPISGHKLLITVATDDHQLRAFVNDGTQAWTFGVNVWHNAPRGLDSDDATVINVQGSQFTAHTEYADIVGANEVEW
jgi:ureidoglycolate lyase